MYICNGSVFIVIILWYRKLEQQDKYCIVYYSWQDHLNSRKIIFNWYLGALLSFFLFFFFKYLLYLFPILPNYDLCYTDMEMKFQHRSATCVRTWQLDVTVERAAGWQNICYQTLTIPFLTHKWQTAWNIDRKVNNTGIILVVNTEMGGGGLIQRIKKLVITKHIYKDVAEAFYHTSGEHSVNYITST